MYIPRKFVLIEHTQNVLKQHNLVFMRQTREFVFFLNTSGLECTQTLYLLKLGTVKIEITITERIDLRPGNHHRLRLLRIELRAPLQTPGVDSCKTIILRFHPLRMRNRSRNNCIDRSNISITHNGVPNKVEDLGGIQYKNKGLKTLP